MLLLPGIKAEEEGPEVDVHGNTSMSTSILILVLLLLFLLLLLLLLLPGIEEKEAPRWTRMATR
jgi:hypothetical protein